MYWVGSGYGKTQVLDSFPIAQPLCHGLNITKIYNSATTLSRRISTLTFLSICLHERKF